MVDSEGVGAPCDAHGENEYTVFCRWPGKNKARCHHCGKDSGQRAWVPAVTWCNEECERLWNAEHPREAAKWTPIEDTLPGGPLDGIWENSGLGLKFQ